jgi:hypothetical protein
MHEHSKDVILKQENVLIEFQVVNVARPGIQTAHHRGQNVSAQHKSLHRLWTN